MKIYELITYEDGNQMVKATLPDKTIQWIPLDPANSDYAEYLRYTEWVESGKKPKDFWAQGEEL